MATSSAPETAAPLTRPASGRKSKTAGCAGSIPAPPSGQPRGFGGQTATGVRGVNLNKGGKPYRAYINVGRKTKWLGTFDTLEESKAARDKAERQHHRKRLS